jgi:hypothetical protein
MKRISIITLIIMIHSGYSALSMSAVDFNKEIEMVSQDQYKTHLVTMNQTGVTEAGVDFENKYRNPATSKSLTFFPLKLRPKPTPRPKTKVAARLIPSDSKVNLIQLYREQVL